MSYHTEPNELSPAYRPLYFRNDRTTSSAAENLKVDVYCWGVKQLEYRRPYTSKNGNDYIFEIDVQSVIQRYLTPKTELGQFPAVFTSLTNFEIIQATDSYCSYYVDTFLEVINDNGLLEEVSGTQETSTTVYAIASTRPPEDPDLESYYFDAGTPFNILTDAIAPQEIGTSENYTLGVVSQNIDAIQLKFYSANGTLTSTVNIDAGAVDANPRLWAVTLGTVNLENFSGSLLAGSDPMPTSFNAGEYYTISFGDGNYTARTEEITLEVVTRCAEAIRIEWFNSFGSADQYTFTGEVIKRQESKGNVREISLPWNDVSGTNLARSHGLLKTDIESTVSYEVREIVSAETAELLRHIGNSPAVYFQRDGFRIAAAVENVSIPIDRGHQHDIEVSFTLITDREITHDI